MWWCGGGGGGGVGFFLLYPCATIKNNVMYLTVLWYNHVAKLEFNLARTLHGMSTLLVSSMLVDLKLCKVDQNWNKQVKLATHSGFDLGQFCNSCFHCSWKMPMLFSKNYCLPFIATQTNFRKSNHRKDNMMMSTSIAHGSIDLTDQSAEGDFPPQRKTIHRKSLCKHRNVMVHSEFKRH